MISAVDNNIIWGILSTIDWRERFNMAWPTLAEDKFDERFKRMWELYLSYCEGGFRAGMIDVKQMLLMHR